jgi:hypothetical protein
MISPMKKLRVTLKRTGNVVVLTMREGRFRSLMSQRQQRVSRGLRALILAQSDLPTTGTLNLMTMWKRLYERVMQVVCCVAPMLAELCGFTGYLACKSPSFIVCCAFSTRPTVLFTEPSRTICIECLISTYYNLIHLALLHKSEYLFWYWWRTYFTVAPTDGLLRRSYFRMVTATPTMRLRQEAHSRILVSRGNRPCRLGRKSSTSS